MESSERPRPTTIRLDPDVVFRVDEWCQAERIRSRSSGINILLDRQLTTEGWPAFDDTQPDTQQHAPEE
jgi:metal-responsive CopG/Arc/MetJ family transcriptional regulator